MPGSSHQRHPHKVSKTERLKQKNEKWIKRQQKKARKATASIASDPIQHNTSHLQSISQHIQIALTSLTQSASSFAASVGSAVRSNPMLTTAGIGFLTATIVEAVNTYSVSPLPPGIPSDCENTGITFDFFDVPQCKTYGVFELVNGTQHLVGQLYDQLTGSRSLYDGSTDCLVSNCRPDTAMSEVYGECIEKSMKAALETVLATAARLGDPILDDHPLAKECMVNMPDWRIAQSDSKGRTSYNVLASVIQVIGPKLLPDICTRFQVEMLSKENDCKDTTDLFVERAKQQGIIVGIVFGSIVGLLLLVGGGCYAYQSCGSCDCSGSCSCGSPCGEDSLLRRGCSAIGNGFVSCMQACASPFVACYEWCTTSKNKGSNGIDRGSIQVEIPPSAHDTHVEIVEIQPPSPPLAYTQETGLYHSAIYPPQPGVQAIYPPYPAQPDGISGVSLYPPEPIDTRLTCSHV